MAYFKDIFSGMYHLMQGMYVSMLNMCRPKVTESYPENRGKHERLERFRGLLVMPHDENNRHKCTACGICMMNCPNKTITVTNRKVTDEATGKEKRALDKYLYDLGSCMFCSLCTITCPQNAIVWTNDFEHTVFTREKLVRQLNNDGSSLVG